MAEKLTPYEYVRKYYKVAKYIQKSKGIPWSMSLATSAYESGWDERAIGFNAFGIKATDSWTGDKIYVATVEVLGGVPKVINDWFRLYTSHFAAFDDYANIILKHYDNKLPKFKDRFEFAKAVSKWYATEPNYADTLISIMQTIEKQEPELIKNKELPKGIYVAPTPGNVIGISCIFVLMLFLFYRIFK